VIRVARKYIHQHEPRKPNAGLSKKTNVLSKLQRVWALCVLPPPPTRPLRPVSRCLVLTSHATRATRARAHAPSTWRTCSPPPPPPPPPPFGANANHPARGFSVSSPPFRLFALIL
jgi:hypothetical protein